jgi:predicted GNAT superfamily acetyltransferase
MLAQWEYAKNNGFTYIAWTYDPLESAVANLYIKKIGAICEAYSENYYGGMQDTLNAGIPSDRFLMKWQGQNHNTEITMDLSKAESLNILHENAENILKPNADLFTVAIPTDYQQLKKDNPAAALNWRLQTRKIFQHYLQHGWQVKGFIKHTKHSYYIVYQQVR